MMVLQIQWFQVTKSVETEKKVDIGDKKRFVKVLGRRKVNLVDLHLPAERKF